MSIRIEAQPVGIGGRGFVIADGLGTRAGKMHVDRFAGKFDAIVPIVNYIDAPQETRIPNADNAYNQSGELPLAVLYPFNTDGEALAFALDLQYSVPVLANVLITTGTATRILPNVFLRPLEFDVVGVSVTVVYPIRFGLVARQ